MGTLVGHEITLLKRLHRKCLASSSLVKEEATIPNSPSQSDSSMNSTANPSAMDTTVLMMPSPTMKMIKAERDSRKPPPPHLLQKRLC